MYETILYIIIIIILIILNGILSMSELAVVSSRKGKLQKMINEGKKHAQTVIDLNENPNQFLSTIQIGITLIGVLTGAFGGATLSTPLANVISPYVPYAESISVLIVVIVTTYLSLVIGELVPKRIALNSPERVAVKVAKSMKILSKICKPFVIILSKSTNAVLTILRINHKEDTSITEEEIELMIEESRVEGNIEKEEEDIIKRVFKLDEQKVDMIMTPRSEIIWIDLDDSPEENKKKIIESKRSIFPIAKGELDDFMGVVQSKDILAVLFENKEMNLEKIVKNPIVVPENLESLELLKQYKENKEYVHMALIVDEFGSVSGLITLNDLLEGIVGDIPGIDETDDPIATQRADGTWLIDGRYQIDRFKELFDYSEEFPDEKEDNFTTIAGFILSFCGKIPEEGEEFIWDRFSFEIVDMDGNKIDKLLITDLGPQEIVEEDED
ncbi:hemolysin family protein [uncultured Methanobrevibacter sp.]|uniref:hemolysin family protein n=1 Tax=uncultured Methanobrevibacter sp. TaxID=253161 RepID=UPI0015B9F56C|nr:hemolysin family protein [uncultured Methanobrevibacter sp.]